MACKYNVYQVVAFRMLAFSVVSILVNTVAIAIVATVYEDIQFTRAFTISITALFTFSIIFLYRLDETAFETVVAVTMAVGWMFGNLLLSYVDNEFYFNFLLTYHYSFMHLFFGSLLYLFEKFEKINSILNKRKEFFNMIVVKDVSKQYGDFTALKQYQFGIYKWSLWFTRSKWRGENDVDQNASDLNCAEQRRNSLQR